MNASTNGPSVTRPVSTSLMISVVFATGVTSSPGVIAGSAAYALATRTFRWEGFRVRRWERALGRRFDACSVISAHERDVLAGHVHRPIAVIPSAVVGYQTNNRLLEGFARYAVQKIDEGDNYSLRGVLFRYLTHDHRQDLTYPNTSVASLSAPVVTEA